MALDVRGRTPRRSAGPSTLGVLVLAALFLSACGDSPAERVAARSVEVVPDRALLVGVGDTVRFAAEARDSFRRLLTDVAPTWRSGESSVVSTDSHGLVRAESQGSTTVSATVDGRTDHATVEVYIPSDPATFEVGSPVQGRRGYVEYIPGDLPLVISVPHGGTMVPDEIADRTSGTTVTDRNTIETALAIRDAFAERTGHVPHLVISRLDRVKLDPNREIVEAAQGDPYAEAAWREFQGFIEIARAAVLQRDPTGLYIDLHGHGHAIPRIEIGYLLGSGDLARPDGHLDAPAFAERSSIRALYHLSDAAFSEVLRGSTSLGGLLAERGFAAVPSPSDPSPGSAPYFTGGYNTLRHGSREDGVGVSGVQLELPWPGVRENAATRAAFAGALTGAVAAYMARHFGVSLP